MGFQISLTLTSLNYTILALFWLSEELFSRLSELLFLLLWYLLGLSKETRLVLGLSKLETLIVKRGVKWVYLFYLLRGSIVRLFDAYNLSRCPLSDLALVSEGLSRDRRVSVLGVYILALVVWEAVDLVSDVPVGLSEDVLGFYGWDVTDVACS